MKLLILLDFIQGEANIFCFDITDGEIIALHNIIGRPALLTFRLVRCSNIAIKRLQESL